MAKKKYSYFVGVMVNGGVKFVTSIDYGTKTARWESGKSAMEFTMERCDELVFGLIMNYNYAFTVKVPNGITFHNAIDREDENV